MRRDSRDSWDSWRRTLDWAADQAVREHRPLPMVHAVAAAEELWRDPQGRDTRVGVVTVSGGAGHTRAPAQLLLDRAHHGRPASDVLPGPVVAPVVEPVIGRARCPVAGVPHP